MPTPAWLYYLFGVLMLVVAGYALVLLVLSLASHRPAGRDVEVSHLFMGLAMAGMFVSAWAFGRSVVWELIFAILLIWFLVRSIQSVRRWGLHVPHAMIHAVMSFAMLLMYWFPMGSSSGSGAMSMSMSSTGPRLDPGLGLVIAFVLFASAIFTLASPVKGGSHYGAHPPSYVMSGGMEGDAGIVEVDDRVAMPWLVDVSHVVMCVGMGFMLILML